MIYYISDLHLNNMPAIIRDHRPFRDEQDEYKTIINNWNQIVSNDDTVYIVGDFCHGGPETIAQAASELNGHKILLRGNHEPDKLPYETSKLFDDFTDYLEIEDSGRNVFLCH